MSIKESLTDSDRTSKRELNQNILQPSASVTSSHTHQIKNSTQETPETLPINFTSQMELEDYLKKEEEKKKTAKLHRARMYQIMILGMAFLRFYLLGMLELTV
jgi:hypothetical protein